MCDLQGPEHLKRAAGLLESYEWRELSPKREAELEREAGSWKREAGS